LRRQNAHGCQHRRIALDQVRLVVQCGPRHRHQRARSPLRQAARLRIGHLPTAGARALSAVHGGPNKGFGILRNEWYVRRYVSNRSQWLRDPDTGKRQRVERPRDEWKIAEVPHLRIVEEDVWQAARGRAEPLSQQPGKGRGALLARC